MSSHIPKALTAGAAILVAVGLFAPGAPASANSGHQLKITVMASSDIHGNAVNWDYYKNAEYDDSAHNDVGLAKISTLVNQIRADRGAGHTLLFDSGDTIQGTPLDYYYAKKEPVTETGATHPMAKAMNAIGYDAVTLGNHEFNYGLPLLATWIDQMKAPVLGANAVSAKTGRPAYQPFILKTMKVKGEKPVKVGILGLTNPGIAVWDKANVDGKLKFLDLVQTAKKWVPVIRGLGADVVLVTAHAGDNGMSSYGSDLPVENASAMVAEQVPGIDAVLFGHAHNDVPQRFVTNKVTGKQVLLTEPGRWGQRLSVVDFTLTKQRGQWTVVGKSSATLNSNTVPEDPKIVSLMKKQHDTTVAYVNQVVAQSKEQLSAAESPYKDTAILDYIQKVQTDLVGKAVAGTPDASLPVLSIAAPFSRTAVFPAGPVSVRDMAGLYVYDNTLLGIKLTGAQIKDYLEYSARYFNQVAPGAPIDLRSLTNAGGTPDYNYDQLSGVTYDIDISKPVGQRIIGLSYQGLPVAADKQFVVAINNYRQSGGGGFPGVTTAPVVYNGQVEIRQALIEYATASGTIDPATFAEANWKLVRDGVPVF
ncbi:multifunctional 2',3'-cyclic-nucleotide 2'-phosphodiesterase/5'-nucleotidase/3'-nucleotidase [Planotetraspora thailandica]|uniref:Multifunctional 2',3'-cyclic-nucleotide 2'-phosphodiesterase/5'-nucleotidase/3'-nucleotidase n=1 Tax=Planotetraspora thailandica TaxID=487172 RepID=A0A8J3Y085_9ACTN|nr:5'-nucleotidase C-terminal domain-containing protein [Planotetraspora thailandica]GII58407.1 multifunctional 2',3'-cyclic-nucleotide 2'-phosphodiesterase/5'-nucleotidase/3'-nucleotidase [Planotetraspora thailandica]